jgi:hypothetical protein
MSITELVDPISGEKVPAYKCVSYSSLIFDSPSKYDMVYWPFTDERWVVINPSNGYGAFYDEFEKLSDSDKKPISIWLKKHFKICNKPISYKEKLDWIGKIYSLRKMDNHFWSKYYCLLAFVYRDSLKDSSYYVAKAIPFLVQEYKRISPGKMRLQILFLLAEYHRRLGDSLKAEEFQEKLRSLASMEEKSIRDSEGARYFLKLLTSPRTPISKSGNDFEGRKMPDEKESGENPPQKIEFETDFGDVQVDDSTF